MSNLLARVSQQATIRALRFITQVSAKQTSKTAAQPRPSPSGATKQRTLSVKPTSQPTTLASQYCTPVQAQAPLATATSATSGSNRLLSFIQKRSLSSSPRTTTHWSSATKFNTLRARFFCTPAESPVVSKVFNARYWLLGSALGVGAVATYLRLGDLSQQEAKAKTTEEVEEEREKELLEAAGRYIDGLPDYTFAEIAKHKSLDDRIWVSYKSGVYDVTEFIEAHPGQDKILLAAGSSLEPFWSMYPQHLVGNVVEILETLRIGNLAKSQQQAAVVGDFQDPYATEPSRHPALVIRSNKPFNAETPLSLLAEHHITPNELFYVRNHLPVPSVDAQTYVLEISGEGKEPIRLTLEDLKTKFKKVAVTASIQCAGNRRNEMTRVKEVKGGSWDVGAISNATWSGASLREVLEHAGIREGDGYKHIQFTGLDHDFEKSYGASIPIEKALDPRGDCVLAYEMNGSELPIDHGFPIRAVVPGVVGARNVKWLSQIIASPNESSSHWQQNDYKGFAPSVDWHNVDWNAAPAIQELPVQSAITQPTNGAVVVGKDELVVKGYAWSGGGKGIVRVDVSVDGGKTWHVADLKKPAQQQGYNRVWDWTLWEASVKLPPQDGEQKLDIVCKAVDSAYNTQPENVPPIWNLRGVLNNAWHHVSVTVPPKNTK